MSCPPFLTVLVPSSPCSQRQYTWPRLPGRASQLLGLRPSSGARHGWGAQKGWVRTAVGWPRLGRVLLHGSGVHGAGRGQRPLQSPPRAIQPPSLSLHSGHFSEGQRPPSPGVGVGSQETCSKVLGFSSCKLREWRERVSISSRLGNSSGAHLSALGEAAWVEPQHLFPSGGEILDKSLDVLTPWFSPL